MIKKLVSKHYRHIPKFLLMIFCTPRNLVVEPIAGCNVKCSACPQDTLRRPYGVMSYQKFRTTIDKMNPTSIGLYFMGEPFLNPNIFKMIKYAHHKGMKTTVNTNGSTLHRDYATISESGLDKIAVSVDGYTQEVFEAYRHGINAEQVYLGLKMLSMNNSHIDSGPHIQVRTLAFESTMKEIQLIRRELERMNITDHRIIEPIITGWGGKENPDIETLGSSGRVKDVKPKICPVFSAWLLPGMGGCFLAVMMFMEKIGSVTSLIKTTWRSCGVPICGDRRLEDVSISAITVMKVKKIDHVSEA